MRQRFANYRLFFNEFRRTFQSTGAVLPSGRQLARALARRVDARKGPTRILEVGPGTGAVTEAIADRMGPDDQLDLVELNERFVGVLQHRLETDAKLQGVAKRVRICQMPVQQMRVDEPYDVIVSGLPLNNFSCPVVAEVFAQFHRLAAERADLSFFQYVAVRKAKAMVARRKERRRLAGIERILKGQFANWEVDRECVVANVPPAWVHHLQLPGDPCSES